ncbi:MAG: exo-alpha-sialidase [Deferribacteres bacterium]|nr:exo-alpha-sialidase [candidate division KSB1 bacterium]MCB9512684.1 exo-alpha-sialidase [Deferribacteres bacterium]
MAVRFFAILLAVFTVCSQFACNSANTPAQQLLSLQLVESPAAAGSGEPNLFASKDGRALLSWMEDLDNGKVALKFSEWQDSSWSVPQLVTSGDHWFVNWADFPSMAMLNDGTLVAHWLAKSAKSTYAYNVNIAFSKDDGGSWSTPIIPHRDGTQTEHGFVSLLPWQNDQLFTVWLDGRNFADSGGHSESSEEMTLRSALLRPDGKIAHEVELDDRTCECCQTSAALLPDGAIVAYRNRSDDEIRDIYVVRLEKGIWSEPQCVFADNWRISGCPVNGPALATLEQSVVVAWFTAAGQKPEVKMAFSADGGKRFGAPILINDGEPMGRVDVVLLNQNTALVSWMEYQGDDGVIKMRRVSNNGSLENSQTIALTGGSRASGFPRMVQSGQSIFFSWTKTGEKPQVMTALAKY